MRSYKLNFDQLQQDAAMSEMLTALERGFKKFNVDFYLIGAMARDAWMGINDKKLTRQTKDVDFAVLIPDSQTFVELKEYLIEEEGFSEYKENAFVLIWNQDHNRREVDLMPFGEIEHNGEVKVEGTGFTSMSVVGFREVYEHGMPELELETGNRFKFCTLAGIVLLKLLAWDDRPEMRPNDIPDISNILKYYFDINQEEIYSDHIALFEDPNLELIEMAAIVLGRTMGAILKRNPNIAQRVENILKAAIDGTNSKIAEQMTKQLENTVEDSVALLKRIADGVNYGLNHQL